MNLKQHTIGAPFTLEGKGLHTGLMLCAQFLPAEENTGIRICRTDLPDRPTHSASARYVSGTERGTVLEHGEWKVSTVEHALSALAAMGVTNCLIEVTGPEMPILDGSALPYVKEIERVGLVPQHADARIYKVTEMRTFENATTGSRITLLPADQFSVEVHVDYHSPVLGEQTAVLEDMSEYANNIANARTFCFVREVQPLLKMGLIKGGDLQNALVIYDQPMPQAEMDSLTDMLGQPHQHAEALGYLSPLKFPNEPARHKLLDLIGDLSLIEARIEGKVIAHRPGHGFNTQVAKQILEVIA